MAPVVRISDENLGVLKALAEPFEDTPDSVLSRVLDALGLRGAPDPKAALAKASETMANRPEDPRPIEAPSHESTRPEDGKGSSNNHVSSTGSFGRVVVGPAPVSRGRVGRKELTPQKEFRRPILRALAQFGGEAAVADILEQVHAFMDGRLLADDYEPVPSGAEIRWWNAAKWERKAMISDGLLCDNSPRGRWTLTDLGWREASKT